MKKLLVLASLVLFVFAAESTVFGKTFVTIGTGGVTGVYYPTGGAISRMVNKKAEEYGIKATVESTAGSVYNINAVLSGDLEFGVAQSDRQFQAYNGLAEWSKTGPRKDLRSVFSIHPESITLIATTDSGVKSVNDLKGKRVNIGNPGSGQLQNSKDVLSAFGIGLESIHAEQVKAVEAPGLMQDEKIDAFFYTVGHPNGNIKEATSSRIKVRIVSIAGAGIDALLKSIRTMPRLLSLRSSTPTRSMKAMSIQWASRQPLLLRKTWMTRSSTPSPRRSLTTWRRSRNCIPPMQC